jgi:hypothetical protein
MNAGKGVLLLLASLSFPAFGNDFSIDSIRTAAAEIRAVRDAQGMAAAQEMIFSCYQRNAYQTCVAQDFILSNVAAREARDPMGVLEEMAERITQAMQRSAVPLAEAKEYILLVKQHGIPAYLQ